jgi:DinB family protein
MKETVARLQQVVESVPARLLALGEEGSRVRRKPDAWSRKQILGHLIDSASNNHQRFVRGQLRAEVDFPAYDGEGFVAVQGYEDEPWEALVELWRAYNRHLVHVMARVPPEKFGHVVRSGPTEPGTLGDHMKDYVVHLERHLAQVFEGGA